MDVSRPAAHIEKSKVTTDPGTRAVHGQKPGIERTGDRISELVKGEWRIAGESNLPKLQLNIGSGTEVLFVTEPRMSKVLSAKTV